MFASLGKAFAYMKKNIPAVIVALILAAAGAVLTIIGPNKIGQMTTLMQKDFTAPLTSKPFQNSEFFLPSSTLQVACSNILSIILWQPLHCGQPKACAASWRKKSIAFP